MKHSFRHWSRRDFRVSVTPRSYTHTRLVRPRARTSLDVQGWAEGKQQHPVDHRNMRITTSRCYSPGLPAQACRESAQSSTSSELSCARSARANFTAATVELL